MKVEEPSLLSLKESLTASFEISCLCFPLVYPPFKYTKSHVTPDLKSVDKFNDRVTTKNSFLYLKTSVKLKL